MTPDQINELYGKIRNHVGELESERETEKIQREAAERLMEARETTRPPISTRPAIRDNPADEDKELESIIDGIINKYGEDVFSTADGIKKVMKEFGMASTKLAFVRATNQSVHEMNKILSLHNAVQREITRFREEIVEYFLVNKTDTKKGLTERVDEAVELARQHLGIERQKGRDEEKRNQNRVRGIRVAQPTTVRRETTRENQETTPTFSDDERKKELQDVLKSRREWRTNRMPGATIRR
jgi:hypothetical protein